MTTRADRQEAAFPVEKFLGTRYCIKRIGITRYTLNSRTYSNAVDSTGRQAVSSKIINKTRAIYETGRPSRRSAERDRLPRNVYHETRKRELGIAIDLPGEKRSQRPWEMESLDEILDRCAKALSYIRILVRISACESLKFNFAFHSIKKK